MNRDVFEFGINEKEEHANFEYNSLSGLGESDYENEDLFTTEQVDGKQQNTSDIADVSPANKDNYKMDDVTSFEMPIDYDYETKASEYIYPINDDIEDDLVENNESSYEDIKDTNPKNDGEKVDSSFLESEESFNESILADEYDIPIVQPTDIPQNKKTTKISLSDTPVEELNKLTEYKEDKVHTTDIKSLFDRVGVNVKEASDIFKKNSEMKEKIDTRFEELKKLQIEVEKNKKNQYDEINSYKEEVLSKLTQKKEEIEKRLNKLKDFQAGLEKEKEEFERYKKQEKEEIERVQKEVQEAYDSRREELSNIEDKLRRQKDALDEERSQLSLDRIQYEADKNELANNLLKFNDIVDSFTTGMDKINKE